MKIAINCAFFQLKGGGIKEYIQNLVENLDKVDDKNEYILYVLKDYYEYAKSTLNTKFRIKAIPFKGNGLVNTIIRSVCEQFFWRKEEKIENWDIFHSPFFHGPTLKKAKLILTVHDMRFYRYPETYTFLRYMFLKHAVRRSIAKADKVIAISQFTKDEIRAAYHTQDEKIIVIHEAINSNHFTAGELSKEDRNKTTQLINKSFILTVGHLEPRKNYNRLINAFQDIKNIIPAKPKLVIVGKKSHNFKSTIEKIENDEDILYLNFVSQELLNWLYKNTSLFVFPSFYEGFGFPPLEAGILGAISAVSNVSSMPEVCGDATLYFDPLDEKDISNCIMIALTDKSIQEKYKLRMKQQLSKFSWKTNALETMKVYNMMA